MSFVGSDGVGGIRLFANKIILMVNDQDLWNLLSSKVFLAFESMLYIYLDLISAEFVVLCSFSSDENVFVLFVLFRRNFM